MSDVNIETQWESRFELVIPERNALGVLTGRTKSFKSDNGDALYDFWQRNRPVSHKTSHQNAEFKKKQKKGKTTK